MKIAITGSTGHLGAAILQELYKRSFEVKALAREHNDFFKDQPVEIVLGNLMQPDSIHALTKDCDALIHCAAVISVNGDPGGIVHQTNVEGTRRVMEAARKNGVKRVIHISSIHAFNQQPSFSLLDEQRELVSEKSFAYDRSKKAGQEIALSMNQPGMEVIVMNPTSIVGPYDHKPSKVGKVIIDLHSGRLPFVFASGFDFCDSRDVAHAIVNGLTMGTPGENYILGGQWYSFKKMISLLSIASGKKLNRISLPLFLGQLGLPIVKSISRMNKKEPLYTNEALEALRSGNRNISSEKAKKELNYIIRPFEETVADTYQWFQQNGYLV